jgi:hypothetical protein
MMVLDAAAKGTKGGEQQTRKPFEVGWLRDVSILTFINKLDREGRQPLHSFIAMLTISKLPHWYVMLLGHGGSKRMGRGGGPSHNTCDPVHRSARHG